MKTRSDEMRLFLAVIILCCPAFAQNDAAIEQAKSACGPAQTRFDVDSANFADSIDYPPSGKALVYVIGEGAITARVGLNGDWAGGITGNSHMSFTVDPGDHHLCASWQYVFAKNNKVVALSAFTAEAGKTYFFRIRGTIQGQQAGAFLDLEQLNADEGKYLVLKTPIAESHIKK
jgi:hypothetical protein